MFPNLVVYPPPFPSNVPHQYIPALDIASLREIRRILQNPDYTENDIQNLIKLLDSTVNENIICRALDFDMKNIVAAMEKKTFEELKSCPFVVLAKFFVEDDEWSTVISFLQTQLIFQESSTGIVLCFLPFLVKEVRKQIDDPVFIFFDYIKDAKNHTEAIRFLMKEVLNTEKKADLPGVATYLDEYAAKRYVLLPARLGSEQLTIDGKRVLGEAMRRVGLADEVREAIRPLWKMYIGGTRPCLTEEGKKIAKEIRGFENRFKNISAYQDIEAYFSIIFF